MRKRVAIPRGQSERDFTRGAQRVHPKNNIGSSSTQFVMRGGIRL